MNQFSLIILGPGGVGRSLIEQLHHSHTRFAEQQIQFNISLVADSNSYIWNPETLSDSELSALIQRKKKRKAISQDPRPTNDALFHLVQQANLPHPILVDLSAATGLESLVASALTNQWGVVLANKKPIAAPWSIAQHYFNHPKLRFEATVGGGQPVVRMMNYFRDTNDPILSVQGQLSGVVTFICQQLETGIPFSQALILAKAKGLTEPDPRDDLGGYDVKRKLLILARLAGWNLDEDAISVESIYPSALAHLSVPEFMVAAVSMNGSLATRFATAATQKQQLRYIASVTPTGGKVQLEPLSLDDPIGQLKHISIQSERYQIEPLLLAGSGGGVVKTASAVVADLLELARTYSH